MKTGCNNETATYCKNGCCYNTKLYCCYKTCSGEFCKTNTAEDLAFQLIGQIIGVVVFLVVLAIMVRMFMKFRSSSGFSGGYRSSDFCPSCSDCKRLCDCDCVDKQKCLDCVSCVFLSPCLFFVWLRQEWRKRVQESEIDHQTSSSVQNNTQGNQDTERQVTGNAHQRPSAPPDFDYSGHGAAASNPAADFQDPPSYDEAMRHGPPAYKESHQYSKDRGVARY